MSMAPDYRYYLELGGIINETDFRIALDRMNNIHTINMASPRVRQALDIAEFSGIKLNDSSALDSRVVLYVILRSDVRPKGVKHHHSQMNDQRIFAEVLRMAGDKDSLDKLIKAHPHVSFEYKRERQIP